MRIIAIRAGDARYETIVGSDLLKTIGPRAAQLFRSTACGIIADSNTAALFAETITTSLRAAGFKPSLITVPAGERSKSLEAVGAVCDQLSAAGLDRSSFIVALGGGVVGDLAGFAAAIYQRGIPYIQVPTTLLAQVDSSIGGKTGVNTEHGKNLLGAVHQPALVLTDVDTLKTLPRREFNQGFAEIIKHGIIADASLFELLEKVAQVSNLRDSEPASWKLAPLIARNIEIKAAIVARDEQDLSGERATLNFGHTLGHGIERAGQYQQFLHGEAVSLGIVAACDVSVRRAGFSEAEREKVTATLAAFGLPTQLPPDFPREEILPAIRSDKKFERGEVRFVVTPRLGSAHLASDVTLEDIRGAIAAL